MKWVSKKHGFTIVELVVVIVVIGILTAITVVAYNAVQRNANGSAAAATLKGVEDKLKLYTAKNNGKLPANLAAAGSSNVNGKFYINYIRFDNNTTYCISTYVPGGNQSNIENYFKVSWRNEPIAKGNCDVQSIAGTPLAYNANKGTTVPFPTISGAPDVILYAAFEVINTDSSYSGIANIATSDSTSRVQIRTNSAGATSMQYRLDSNVFSNITAAQSARTPGLHVGWVQVTEEATVREFGFDKSEAHTTGSLTSGTNWSFNGLSLSASSASQIPLEAVVFNANHDAATRERILQLLIANWA